MVVACLAVVAVAVAIDRITRYGESSRHAPVYTEAVASVPRMWWARL